MKTRTRTIVAVIAVLILLVPACPAGPVYANESTSQETAPAPQASAAAAHVEKAQALLAASEFTNAENELRLAIAADPAYPLSYAWMGQVFAAQPGREKDALENAEKAANMAPKDSRVLALLADVQRRQYNVEALKTAEQAVSLNPDDSFAQAALALAYADDAQWDKAKTAAIKAVKLDPKLARSYHAMGIVYARVRDVVRARRALDEMIKLEPKSVQWRLALGGALKNLGDFDGAKVQYDAAAQILPDYPATLNAVAHLTIFTNYSEIADRKVDRAVKVAPNLWETRLVQALLAAKEGKYDAAESHYLRALAVSPDNFRIQAERIITKLNAGQCNEAKTLIEKELETRPRQASLHADLATAYSCLEDNKKALAEAEKAIGLDPYDPQIWMTLISAQRTAERTEDTLASYGLAASIAAFPAYFVSETGMRYLDAGQYAEAETELGLAIDLGADDVGTRFWFCLSELAQEKFAEAADACGAAYELDSSYPTLGQRYAVALLASGRAKDAIPLLKKAISDGDKNADSHMYLGLAYIKTRQYKLAVSEYETYLKMSEEKDQAAEQMLALLKAGWPLKDAEAIDQLDLVSQKFLDGRLTAKITGKSAKDRRLVLSVSSGAKDTPEMMATRTLVAAGLAAIFGARLDPPVAGATINGLDGKGKPYLTLKAELEDLQDVALQIVSEAGMLSRFNIDAGAPGEQAVTKADIEQVGKDAAEVRGLQVRKPISVTMITPEEFAAQYKEEVAAETGTDNEQSEALYRLLGVLGPDAKLDEIAGDLASEQVVGYYDNRTDDLRVLNGKTPTSFQRLTMAHEYVHALQDQNFPNLSAADSDASMAVTALLEGDATLAETQYAESKVALVDSLQMFSNATGELDEQAVRSAPAFLSQLFSFPYEAGQDFVTAAYDRGGWKEVDGLYVRPPASTEQILHPERYRADEKPVAVKLPKVAERLGAGWTLAEEEVMGEIAWRALLQPDIGPTFAAQASTGWGGDRYALVKDKGGGYGLAVVADWDTLEDQQEFTALLGLALRSKLGYEEQTDDLLAENPVRVWQGPQDCWAIHSDGKRVLIGIAKTRETAEKLVAAISG